MQLLWFARGYKYRKDWVMMALISRMEGKESLSSIFLFFRGYNYKSWSLIPNIQIIDLSSWWRQKYKFNCNLKYTISSGSVSKCSIHMSNQLLGGEKYVWVGYSNVLFVCAEVYSEVSPNYFSFVALLFKRSVLKFFLFECQ